MSKLASPAIQWYFKQWLGDQKVLAMDWDANGMHFWLINLSLQEDPVGTIPNDTGLIRRWLRNPPDDVWRRVQPQIFSAWSLQDGRWHQKGAVAAGERQLANSKKRKEAAESRWRDANALQMDMQKVCSSSSTSSSLKTKTNTTAVAVELPEWIDREVWDAYLEMRKKKRAVPTERAIKGILKQLGNFRNKGHDPNAVLETSTRSDWTDVYEPKAGENDGIFKHRYEPGISTGANTISDDEANEVRKRLGLPALERAQ